MTDYNGIYNKLTKKELLITLMTRDFMVDNRRKEVIQLKNQLALTEKALELACKELYDSDSISVCSYCIHNLYAECPDVCPSDKHILTNYFKTEAKEMMKSE